MNRKLHWLLYLSVLFSLVKVKAKNVKREDSLTEITDSNDQLLHFSTNGQTISKSPKTTSHNDQTVTEVVDDEEEMDHTNHIKKETAGELDGMVDRLFNNLISYTNLSKETTSETSLSSKNPKKAETGTAALKSSVDLVKNELESFKKEDMNDTKKHNSPQILPDQKDTELKVNAKGSMMEDEGRTSDNSSASKQNNTHPMLPMKENANPFKDQNIKTLKEEAKEIEAQIQEENLLLATPKTDGHGNTAKKRISIDQFKLKDPIALKRLGKAASVVAKTKMAGAVNETATIVANQNQENSSNMLTNNRHDSNIQIRKDTDVSTIVGSSGSILKIPDVQFSNTSEQAASSPDYTNLSGKNSGSKSKTAVNFPQYLRGKSSDGGSGQELLEKIHSEHIFENKLTPNENNSKQLTYSTKISKELQGLLEKPQTEQNNHKVSSSDNNVKLETKAKQQVNGKPLKEQKPLSTYSRNDENDIKNSKLNAKEAEDVTIAKTNDNGLPEKSDSLKHLKMPKSTSSDDDSQNLSNWSLWSTCSATCGTNAIQIRTRKCTNDNHNPDACKQKTVDWRPCIYSAKNLICKENKQHHNLKQAPLVFLSDLVNRTVSGTLENQDPRYQWGKWSSCPQKCGGQKNIKVRRRICPGQRSFDTGVCLKPTMQWSWCKLEPCNGQNAVAFGNNIHFKQKTQDNDNFSGKNSFFKFKNLKQDLRDEGVHFTPKCTTSTWSAWSLCSRTCGENSRKYRTRSCSCRVKSECDQPIIEWNHCTLNACPGEENYGPWTEFSRCTKSCGAGWKKRLRHCIKRHNTQHTKNGCDQDLLIGVRVCNVQKCPPVPYKNAAGRPMKKVIQFETPHVQLNMKPTRRYKYSQKLVNDYISNVIQPYEDSESSCGFLPCEEFGCLDNPYSKCLSDSNCDPVFYDLSGNVHQRCTDWGRYFIKKPAMFCGYNPCDTSRCQTPYGRCYVDLKCRPIVTEFDGSLIDCRQLIVNAYKRTFYTPRPLLTTTRLTQQYPG